MGEKPVEMPAPWLAELDRIFAGTLERVADDELGEPTGLPGWTRSHVVAHIHFNALALCRLVGWARTGVEAAMYTSAAQRSEDIERGALERPATLRALVSASAAQFSSAFGQLTSDERARIVVTGQGRRIPAGELAWLRCRELGVHSVDLCAGTTFDDLPATFVEALVREIVAKRVTAGEGPTLAAWLSGRRDTPEPLDRWL